MVDTLSNIIFPFQIKYIQFCNGDDLFSIVKLQSKYQSQIKEQRERLTNLNKLFRVKERKWKERNIQPIISYFDRGRGPGWEVRRGGGGRRSEKKQPDILAVLAG